MTVTFLPQGSGFLMFHWLALVLLICLFFISFDRFEPRFTVSLQVLHVFNRRLPIFTGLYRLLQVFAGFYRLFICFTSFLPVLHVFICFYVLLPAFYQFFRSFAGFDRLVAGFYIFYIPGFA